VIPSYNHAAFIADAVHSVLAQSTPDLELIVVDDGSTDESLDVLAGFNDPRLCVMRQPNQGAHAAINRGLEHATAPYLALLNSDDVYHPQRLEKIVAMLEDDATIGLAGSFIEVIDSQGHPLGVKHGYADLEPWLLEAPERSFRAGADLRAALLTENYYATTSNFVFRRRWYEQVVGGFRPLRYTHDWDFALRIARVARLALLPEPLLRYRLHAKNTIRENQAAMVFEICWCLAVHLPEHIADESWFGKTPPDQRAAQLLHSIYCYGCEDVLNVMLLQGLWANTESALRLLAADDPSRAVYIDFIGRRLARGAGDENGGRCLIGCARRACQPGLGNRLHRLTLSAIV
jgi:glycosyltransferase involved in cell wall biosynthesis